MMIEPVDQFLYEILRNSTDFTDQNVQFLCRSEDSIVSFLLCSDRNELEFPPLNSYFRRIIHRLGRRYNLVHRVESTNLFNAESSRRKIYLAKPVETDGTDSNFLTAPLLKCVDWLPERVQTVQLCVLSSLRDSMQSVNSHATAGTAASGATAEPTPSSIKPSKLKILKRTTNPSTSPIVEQDHQHHQASNAPLLSLEEREARYQEARDRIFEGFVVETESQEPQIIMSLVEPLPKQSISTQLNPDATPFFVPQQQQQSQSEEPPQVTINHIYMIKSLAPDVLLHKEDLLKILSINPEKPSIIKTRQLPTNSAFLLLTDELDNKNYSDSTLWSIEKWTPEILLD